MAGEQILVVDDSVSAQQFAALALRNAGYRVETTDEIWIAHLVRQLRPRMILMEVQMGTARSGLVVVKGLNAMTIRKEMLIYFYSSQPEEELKQLVATHGADGYIMKATDMEELAQQVTAALAAHAGE